MQRFLLVIFVGIVAGAVIATASLVSQKAQAETPAVIAIEDVVNDAVPMRDCPCGCEREGKPNCYYVCGDVKDGKCLRPQKKCESVCAQCLHCDNGK